MNLYKNWGIFYTDNISFVRKCVSHKVSCLGGYLLSNEKEDIVQDIFLKIWEKDLLSTIKKRESIRSWLFKFSVNYTVNYFRKTLRCPSATGARESVNIGSLPHQKEYELTRVRPDPLQISIFNETFFRIASAITRLPYNHRKVLRLFITGNTHKQISKVLDISAAYSAVLLRRARRRLRIHISKEPLIPYKRIKKGGNNGKDRKNGSYGR
jgi:RNA polymerase sigma factor (sigma-70 family)